MSSVSTRKCSSRVRGIAFLAWDSRQGGSIVAPSGGVHFHIHSIFPKRRDAPQAPEPATIFENDIVNNSAGRRQSRRRYPHETRGSHRMPGNRLLAATLLMAMLPLPACSPAGQNDTAPAQLTQGSSAPTLLRREPTQ